MRDNVEAVLVVLGFLLFLWLSWRWIAAKIQKRRANLPSSPFKASSLILPLSLGVLGYSISVGASDWGAKRMRVFSDALTMTESAGAVKEQIGLPITVGWPVKLTAGLTDKGNDVEMKIPISGQMSSGYISVLGKKESGVWTITNLYVTRHLAGGWTTTIYKK